MTQTTTCIKQTLALSSAQNAEITKEPDIRENIRDLLSVCDSLNRLCETLCRLENVLKRKEIETDLTKRSV